MNKKEERLIITQKPPKGDDGFKTFSIRVREDLVTQIEQISKRTGRSRNELIGMLLQYALGKCEVEEGE